jgi:hypothetical protein
VQLAKQSKRLLEGRQASGEVSMADLQWEGEVVKRVGDGSLVATGSRDGDALLIEGPRSGQVSLPVGDSAGSLEREQALGRVVARRRHAEYGLEPSATFP